VNCEFFDDDIEHENSGTTRNKYKDHALTYLSLHFFLPLIDGLRVTTM